MFQFTLYRLLLVVAVFSVLFAWMRPYGTAGLITATVTGTALGGIVILATRKNLGTIVSACIWGFIGAFVNGVCCAPGMRSGDHQSQVMEDVSRYTLGAVLGWFLGCCLVRLARIEDELLYGHRHEDVDASTSDHSSDQISNPVDNKSTPTKDRPSNNC